MLPVISFGLLPNRPLTGSCCPPCPTKRKLFYIQAVSFADRATPRETAVSTTWDGPQPVPGILTTILLAIALPGACGLCSSGIHVGR